MERHCKAGGRCRLPDQSVDVTPARANHRVIREVTLTLRKNADRADDPGPVPHLPVVDGDTVRVRLHRSTVHQAMLRGTEET